MLVLVIMLLIVGLIAYTLVTERLMTNLDEQLQQKALELRATARLLAPTGLTDNPNLLTQLLERQRTENTTSTPLRLQFFDPATGQPQAATTPGPSLTPSQPDFENARAGKSSFTTQRDPNGREVRSFTFALFDGAGRVEAVTKIGYSVQAIDQVRTVLTTVFILMLVTSAILVYIGGYWLISRELQPLRLLAATMHNLSARQLHLRLPPPKPATNEAHLLAEAFNQMLDRLEASFALQQAFVADVSHELRTPLTMIRMQFEVILLNPALDGQTRQDVQQVNAELARLSRLVVNLLTNARAEAGQLPAPPASGSKKLELDNLVVSVVRQASFLNPRVKLTVGPLEQISLSGDEDMLKQMLLNLLDNALKYTPDEGTVTLSLTRQEQAGKMGEGDEPARGERALIGVRDSGPGIPASEIPRIFERFYRGEQGNARSKLGSGLGLYIARLIAEGHGGQIRVESEPGQGSCFEVSLPIR